MNAREILEELGLKEDNYTKHQWDDFERLIKSYNEEKIEELEDKIIDLEDDVSNLEYEINEFKQTVDDLTDKLEEANTEIENLKSNQK